MNKKVYYSIKEISTMLELKPYILRYWETEFKELCPRKHNGNRRMYTNKDINVIKTIKHLLYDKGFTIKGARKTLKSKDELKQLKLEFNETIDRKYIISKLEDIINLIKG